MVFTLLWKNLKHDQIHYLNCNDDEIRHLNQNFSVWIKVFPLYCWNYSIKFKKKKQQGFTKLKTLDANVMSQITFTV